MVLDAALKVYLREGFDAASMDAIAEEAGVTKPVVYSCFPTKRDLFQALLERQRAEVVESLMTELRALGEPGGAGQALTAGFRAHLRSVASHPDAYRAVLLAGRGSDLELGRHVDQWRAQSLELIAHAVRSWLERERVPDAHEVATVLAHGIRGFAEALAVLYLSEPDRWEPDRLADIAAAFMDDGRSRFAPGPDLH
jgi:AcrR family transcriptional regulator